MVIPRIDFILTRLGGLNDLTLCLQVSSVVKVGPTRTKLCGSAHVGL